jgi:hypothetical protein
MLKSPTSVMEVTVQAKAEKITMEGGGLRRNIITSTLVPVASNFPPASFREFLQ